MCDLFGNMCFNKVMETVKVHECLPDCNQLQFSVSAELKKLDFDTLCYNNLGRERSIVQRFASRNGYEITSLLKKIEEWLVMGNEKNETAYYGTNELCKEIIGKNMAKVSVMFESSKYMRTKMSRKVTFVDKLGLFGKI